MVREGKIIHGGEVGTLKRFKDDVKEVRENYECGISFKDYSDILVKDEIEFLYNQGSSKRIIVWTISQVFEPKNLNSPLKD